MRLNGRKSLSSSSSLFGRRSASNSRSHRFSALTGLGGPTKSQVRDFVRLLLDHARESNQGFHYGSFIIEDPNHELFEFLKNCPSTVRQCVRNKTRDFHLHLQLLLGCMYYFGVF